MTQLVESSLKRERRKMESSCDGLLVAIRELEKEDAVLTADCVKRLRILRSLNAYVGDCFLQTSGNADMDWDADAEDDLFHRLTDELNQRLDELTGIRERIRELERRRERYVYELTLCTVAATTLLMPPTNGKA